MSHHTRHTSAAPATLGILMVKTHFRRYLGDIGNADTWSFPVRYRVVEEAIPQRMGHLQQHDLLEPFKRAAQSLIDEGVDGLTTSCGYLSYYQQELAAWSPVPIVTSSLLQYPLVQRLLPAGKQPLILTFDDGTLRGDYLARVGIDPQAAVAGMPPDSEFVRSIRSGDDGVPYAVLEREVLRAAEQALARFPDSGALVLECTNLAPFSASLHAHLGLPVFDTVTLVNWFQAALRPRRYDGGEKWCL
ncbi:aspartate/glutamate racemase family protein [Brenneria tiliae]|uniref:Aspartate/glutamate racemase family protein n=1 Tax=Brenneria tiliae TaxID=2914984 RepID=A0ABT0MUZ5_9GAMM|nr:aspartate/glutamate racemase family protein [Brenneria tiliae]MCL2893673.1 aspartate/glutamate racemase family protein [Brenneria tiliae]MCL2899187.1 aspartate/glutamate racemase family protein [Brenneria tiliae]MCL2903565.1 aspartate/glutamate racemase family protein [Brenneria tiliae]